ncbi:ERF family protein [Nonomuraea sp. NPDC050328]|uniref:ERF family protein n=1 Tax=Nonomuraea sp. NPDC050328 TaxID=3364361 RepID=UPI00379DEFE8
MTTLKDRAAALARPDDTTPAAPAAAPATSVEVLPDIELDVPEGGPEAVPVHVAWSRVMGDIRKIGKNELYNAAGTRYNFRGVDRTVNAFAPVLRRHGVLVLPVHVDASYRDFKNSNNKVQRECTVVVTWMVIGPAGDTLPSTLQTAGEALDSADKGTAKAQSVALRVLLLTAAMVPTGDPDPDSQYIERGEASVRPAASYVEEITDPRTSANRLRQIHHELKQTGQLAALVTNEVGDDEQVGAMVVRIGKERSGGDR